MDGLLDFAASPAGQGLLGAVFSGLAGARRGQPINNVGRAGMAGLIGYNQAQQNQAEAAKDMQRSKLFDMQVQQMQEQQARQKAAQEALQRRQDYLGSVGKVTSPRVDAQPNQFDPMAWIRMDGSLEEAKSLAGAKNWGRPTIKDYKDIRNPDGSVTIVGLNEYGDQTKTGLTPFKDPKFQDMGGNVVAIDPVTMQPLWSGNKSMTPDGRDASARFWAKQNYDQAKDKAEASTGVIYQQDANGNLVALPKNVNPGAPVSPIPVMAPGGQPMQGKGSPKASLANQYSVVKSALTEVKKLIPDATSSGIGAARDTAAGFFGKTTDAANAAAKLDTYGAWLSSNVPRFEGPQSDADRLYYAQMAGNIGNRKVPVEQRLAAVQALEKFMDERANVYGINTNQTPSQTSGGASVSNW